MKRKLLAIFLVLLLALAAVPALAEEEARAETIRQLNMLVEDFIKSEGYRYEFEDNVFTLEFSLDGTLGSCTTRIRVFYDAIEVISQPDLRVPEDNREKLSTYFLLVNHEIFYAQYGMSMDSGRCYTRSVQFVEKTMPGFEELGVILDMSIYYLEDYGDGIIKVALTGADPYEAFAEAVRKLESE